MLSDNGQAGWAVVRALKTCRGGEIRWGKLPEITGLKKTRFVVQASTWPSGPCGLAVVVSNLFPVTST